MLPGSRESGHPCQAQRTWALAIEHVVRRKGVGPGRIDAVGVQARRADGHRR